MMMNGLQNNMNMNMNGMNNMQNNMMNPGMMNQGMMNQGMMNQGMMNPGMMNNGMMNPGMMNNGMMNPGMMNPAMNPGMMNQGMMINMMQNVAVLNNVMNVMMNKMQEMNRQVVVNKENSANNNNNTNTSGNINQNETPTNLPPNMIGVIFSRTNPGDKNKNFKITIICSPNDKVKDVIDNFCHKSMEKKDELLFIFNAEKISDNNNKLNRTIASFGIINQSQIMVVNKQRMKGGINL